LKLQHETRVLKVNLYTGITFARLNVFCKSF